MKRLSTVCAATALALAACGADKQRAKSPEAAQKAADSVATAEAAGGADYAPPPPPAAPAQPQPGQAGGASLRPGVAAAARELDVASRELDVSAGDCQAACRALGSMDRSAGRLCEIAHDGDELRRCDDAKRRVFGARDKVRETCGSCPGGPSVDRGAPVPSVR